MCTYVQMYCSWKTRRKHKENQLTWEKCYRVYFTGFFAFQFVFCLCLIKVPLYLSDEMEHFSNSRSQPATDITSEKSSSAPVPCTVSKQNAGDLLVLLDALDRNLAEQGVIVQPKGLCSACLKPIVGQVSIIKVEWMNMNAFKRIIYIHTYIHTFNRLFSRTTWVSLHQKGKPFWILLKQEMMGGSGISWTICKSFTPHSRQITMPVSHHPIFYGPDALPDSQPTESEWQSYTIWINAFWFHLCYMAVVFCSQWPFIWSLEIIPLHAF